MWPFFKRKQADNQISQSKKPRRPTELPELLDEIGHLPDLSKHDAPMKFWLPEAAAKALPQISERYDVSSSEFLRQFFVVHCYGLFAYHKIADEKSRTFKKLMDSPSGPRFSRASDDEIADRIRSITYWVPELGKNIAPVKVWVPKRVKADLETLAGHVGLTLSNYVREILISRLFGHGMLPQRPELFKAIPTTEAESWDNDLEVEWRELTSEEIEHYAGIGVIEGREEWGLSGNSGCRKKPNFNSP